MVSQSLSLGEIWSGAAGFVAALADGAVLQSAIEERIAAADGWVAYLVVFVLAAIPWFEVLLVIPPGIALGLDPVLVVTLAFAGNLLTLLLVVALQSRLMDWYRRRYGGEEGSSRRSRWARRLWERYGLVALAFAAPLLTGSHLGAVLALLLGASSRAVAIWMTVSLLVWSIGLGVVTVGGLSLLGI